MEGIFENVEFGSRFDINGSKGVIIGIYENSRGEYIYKMYIEEWGIFEYNQDGTAKGLPESSWLNEISKYHKPTDEKELLEKSLMYCVSVFNKKHNMDAKHYNEIGDGGWNCPDYNCDDLSDAYITGYCKAKEE